MGSCLSRMPTTWGTVRVKTMDKKHPSLDTLPVEILQYISVTFLPSDAAASLALCSHSMLNILGSQVLHSLRLESRAIEKTRFLDLLWKDLPDWLLCHHCSKLHPVDQNGDPSKRWRQFEETECSRVNGVVSFRYNYNIRYEYAQLLMRNYRLERPYKTNLENLSKRFALHLPEKTLESVVTANIVDGELLLQIKHTLRLLKEWDISTIQTNIPKICPHLADRVRDLTFPQALRCRLSHANGWSCVECKKQKHCMECSTSFRVDVRMLENFVTEVQVDVRRCLGSCESAFDSKWRRQADRFLPRVGERYGRRDDRESRGSVFPMFGATDEELAKWCASV